MNFGRALILVYLFGLLTACDKPFGIFPGAELDSPVKDVPAEWAFAQLSGLAQLEVNPNEPYSVNLVYTVVDGQIYINAGDTRTKWVEFIEENPNIRLQIDEAIYELKADRVNDAEVVAKFAEQWTKQSFFRRDPSKLDELFLFRLTKR